MSDTQASATALGPLAKIAADLATFSGVSYHDALGDLLMASELLARAWDLGARAAVDAQPRSSPAPGSNPYRSAL